MANPQVENGYTRIANELLEALCRINLSPYEDRVLMAIMRKTFGFGKSGDAISIRQLSELTHLDFRHTHRALKSLVSRQIISSKGAPGQTSIIGIQQNYDLWITSTDASRGDTLKGDTCREEGSVTNTGIGSVTSRDDNKRKKEKKENPEEISAEISSLLSRYSDQQMMDKTYQAICSTRKQGKISDSVWLRILQSMEKHSADHVMEGVNVYLNKDFAAQGKCEKYLMGIIRKQNGKISPSQDGNWFDRGAI